MVSRSMVLTGRMRNNSTTLTGIVQTETGIHSHYSNSFRAIIENKIRKYSFGKVLDLFQKSLSLTTTAEKLPDSDASVTQIIRAGERSQVASYDVDGHHLRLSKNHNFFSCCTRHNTANLFTSHHPKIKQLGNNEEPLECDCNQ